MNAVCRLAFVALALVLATCNAFHVSPATSLSFVRSAPVAAAAARHPATQTRHAPSPSRNHRAFSAAGVREVSMTAEGPRSSRNVQRVAAVAAATSVATLTSSAIPAHAEGFAQYFAQGVVGAINGPGILAIPVILGFGLASAIAFFIFFFSQPREYDD